MISISDELLQHIEIFVVSDEVRFGQFNNVTFCAIEDLAHLVALGAAEQAVQDFVPRIVHRQTAGLEDNALIAVVINRNLGVRRVTRIDVVLGLCVQLDSRVALRR